MEKLDFKYDVNETPATKRESVGFAIQHVFAMFGSCVLVPTLIGLDIGVSLAAAGIGTLIYTQTTSKKVPVFIGSSFAYIAILTTLNEGVGIAGVAMAVLSVGVLYLMIAGLIAVIGDK